jgi:hypothetical protein
MGFGTKNIVLISDNNQIFPNSTFGNNVTQNLSMILAGINYHF